MNRSWSWTLIVALLHWLDYKTLQLLLLLILLFFALFQVANQRTKMLTTNITKLLLVALLGLTCCHSKPLESEAKKSQAEIRCTHLSIVYPLCLEGNQNNLRKKKLITGLKCKVLIQCHRTLKMLVKKNCLLIFWSSRLVFPNQGWDSPSSTTSFLT